MRIETPRLILRNPVLGDALGLFAILGDSESMPYAHVDPSLRACRRRIAAHERRRRHDGYAPWTILDRRDHRIIGWGGLSQDPFDIGWGAEVSYYISPLFRRQGYATELVAASIQIADNELCLAELTAFAHPRNIASQHLLEHAGFTFVHFVPEMTRLRYQRLRKSPSS